MNRPSGRDAISPRQIEPFKAVVDAGSVTAAAAAVNISQPSVSRLLSSLEETIGFALFERRKGRLLTTPEATLFCDEIQKYFIPFSGWRILRPISGRWRLGSCGWARSLRLPLPSRRP